MPSYAVFWRNGGIAFHGRLELDLHGLWLQGGELGHELRFEIPFDEVVGVERDAKMKIGSCQAIRVQTRGAVRNLLIASSNGSLSEIQEAVCDAIAHRVSARTPSHVPGAQSVGGRRRFSLQVGGPVGT